MSLLRTNFRVKISVCRRVFIARLLMTITTNGETLKGDVVHQIYTVFFVRSVYMQKLFVHLNTKVAACTREILHKRDRRRNKTEVLFRVLSTDLILVRRQ